MQTIQEFSEYVGINQPRHISLPVKRAIGVIYASGFAEKRNWSKLKRPAKRKTGSTETWSQKRDEINLYVLVNSGRKD